ncbi:hypothetical protein DICPUDRAFT_155868 [Dictyostelium purpureum]|uniref:Uncharacterized protein n=1 Tax=Dictyostelium purpureum TaxID=5786 RepID=F0ZV36_DICPU|nr:uncharacterized protein DICPUDRAFT_155868 [Dictyostelium purpureum]EGC32208.1 hypothetical protein DICPUDRAFT_155868 [Dictyostelium purpureum]|eukprot:XP_003291280.1 hypothetical protein DICPUDRAFT_155868 [Dictyostelium purpureum]
MEFLEEKFEKEINNKSNNEYLNEIIKLISGAVSNEDKNSNIVQLKEFSEKRESEEFFKKLFEMITLENGELNETYNEISWELVHSLVQSLNHYSSDWDIKNHTNINSTCRNILNIIDWISSNSSAREFLLIIQEFDGSSFITLTTFTKISMIIFTKNALKRIPTEKRFNFLKSILPPFLRLLIEDKKEVDENNSTPHEHRQGEFGEDDQDEEEDDQDEEEDDSDDDDGDDAESSKSNNHNKIKKKKKSIKILGPDLEQELQQQNTENDLKWQYPLSCILDFVYTFSLDLKAQDVSNDDPNSGITTPRAINRESKQEKPNTPIAQQQHLFLNFLVTILSLESTLNPPQSLLCNGVPLLGVIGECLSLIGASTTYILGTDQRFRLKNREIELEDMYLDEGLDEDDFQNDIDLNLNDPNISKKNKKKNSKNNGNDDEEQFNDSDFYSSDEEDSDSENNNDDDEKGIEIDEEDEYSSIEKLFDLDLPYAGIGHLLYLLVLKPTEQYRLPSLQSPQSILMDNLPYLINLLQHKSYKIGFKTIQIISFLQKRIKEGTIKVHEEFLKNPYIEDSIQDLLSKALSSNKGEIDHKQIQEAFSQDKEKKHRNRWINDQTTSSIEKPYHFLQLIECIINFLVKCPVQQMRSFSYKVLVLLMNTLTPSTRFYLLANLISTCIFPSFTGLLIHVFKEEINKAWLSTDVDSRVYFVSPKILEVVTIPIQTGGNLMERMDSIMNGLNMYRYLLLRDKDSNHTGIWSKSKIQGSRESCFYPLRRDLLEVQSQFKASAEGDEKAMEKVLKGVSKMGVKDLSKDEIKNACTLVTFHIDMAIDVINRILELQDELLNKE